MNKLRSIRIETTQACNLRCIMCASVLPDYSADHLGRGVFEKVLSVLRQFRPSVDLNGHGETLLHKDFARMLDEVVDAGCRASFQTNAMLLTPELLARILKRAGENGLRTITTSIDAADKELFEEIRRGADFDEFVGNLKALRRMKERRGAAYPTLTFVMVAMLMNIHQLPEIVRLVKDLGGAKLSVCQLTEYDLVRGQRLSHDIEYARPFLETGIAAAKEVGISLELQPALKNDLAPPRSGVASVEEPAGPRQSVLETVLKGARVKACRDPWTKPFVTASGDVRPCCWMAKSMGNLNELSFEEIWRGTDYRELRRMVVSTQPPKECLICDAKGWRRRRLGPLFDQVRTSLGGELPPC